MTGRPETDMPTAWRQAILRSLAVGLMGVAVGQKTKPTQEVEPEAYAVYSAILTQHYASWFKGKDPVLISSYTRLEPQGHQGSNCRERAKDKKTVQDLLEQLLSEKESFQISPKLRVPGKYQMVRRSAQVRENQEPGLVFFSNVEFSPDRSKAMILVGHNCGGLCGNGFVWILDKHGGRWSLAKDQLNCGWIK
jgi:hypothetical protein